MALNLEDREGAWWVGTFFGLLVCGQAVAWLRDLRARRHSGGRR